jgi:hypothetical protein
LIIEALGATITCCDFTNASFFVQQNNTREVYDYCVKADAAIKKKLISLRRKAK